MEKKLSLECSVNYGDVDREGVVSLSGVMRLLQEAAIRQANSFDAGTDFEGRRGESWVLNRVALEFFGAVRFEDVVRVETWSSGISGFRGYRDFRIFRGEELLAAGSSLWLYVNLASRSLTRVPADVAAGFPLEEEVFRTGLERLAFALPGEEARGCEVSLRYSDVDSNGHVNNTVYFEFLQTALSRAGFAARVREVQVKFAREIPPDAESVRVRLEEVGDGVVFSVEGEVGVFAQGKVVF